MTDVIALVRMMNLYYHHLHNIAHGPSFEGDHSLMSDFYTELEESYDALVERYIGIGGEMGREQIISILNEATELMSDIPDTEEMDTYFYYSQALESSLRAELEEACIGASLGTKNLLEELSGASECRSYKLSRRVK